LKAIMTMIVQLKKKLKQTKSKKSVRFQSKLKNSLA
jgi:hypothetical protein